LQEDVIAFNHHHPNKCIIKPYFGKGFTSTWNRKRRLKNGKRNIFQKLIGRNMAKICDFISSGFFQHRIKERISVF